MRFNDEFYYEYISERYKKKVVGVEDVPIVLEPFEIGQKITFEDGTVKIFRTITGEDGLTEFVLMDLEDFLE